MRSANIVLLLSLIVLGGCGTGSPQSRESQSVAAALGDDGDTAGYARADHVRDFDFPADHGAHPDYRNEWWYFTGNLGTANGRRFGYQLTFFRIALSPEQTVSESRWRTRQLYMAHFALSDIDGDAFHAFERFGRGAAGLAGANNPPLRVWVDQWSAEAQKDSGFPMRLRASEDGIAIDLTVTPEKPIALNGQGGLSRKSAEPGNASYYYSVTRLRTDGTVSVEGATFPVGGASWLDREWGTSALAQDQAGWDWFALQLDDGRDLMLYRLRRKDGSMDPASAGTLAAPDGTVEALSAEDFSMVAETYWTSPASGVRYPARWELALPSRDLVLKVEPLRSNQELNLTVRYWEGAVRVVGTEGGRPIAGRGYMELAGYGD